MEQSDYGKIICKYYYGKTKSEVLQKKDALLEQRKGPVYIDTDRITIGQWVEKWLIIYAKASVRETTYAGYRYCSMSTPTVCQRPGKNRLMAQFFFPAAPTDHETPLQ